MMSITFVMNVLRDMLNSRREFIWVCNNLSIISSIEQRPSICKRSHTSLRVIDNWVGHATAYFTKYCSISCYVSW